MVGKTGFLTVFESDKSASPPGVILVGLLSFFDKNAIGAVGLDIELLMRLAIIAGKNIFLFCSLFSKKIPY